MLNTEGFTKRLQSLLHYYNLSASAFAEKIGIGRSSISHIVSGRNKPSLEIVLSILENFEEVAFDWLMYGKGNFPKVEEKKEVPSSPIQKKAGLSQATTLFENKPVNENNLDLFSNMAKNETVEIKDKSNNGTEEIERVIIFYKNGSFKEYKN